MVRIGSIIIFHLSKLGKATFFKMCDVKFLVRLQEKFQIDHSLSRPLPRPPWVRFVCGYALLSESLWWATTCLDFGPEFVQVEQSLHVDQRLPDVAVHRAQEVERDGELKKQAIDHHQVADRHRAWEKGGKMNQARSQVFTSGRNREMEALGNKGGWLGHNRDRGAYWSGSEGAQHERRVSIRKLRGNLEIYKYWNCIRNFCEHIIVWNGHLRKTNWMSSGKKNRLMTQVNPPYPAWSVCLPTAWPWWSSS